MEAPKVSVRGYLTEEKLPKTRLPNRLFQILAMITKKYHTNLKVEILRNSGVYVVKIEPRYRLIE